MIFKILVGNCAPKFERFQYYFTSMQHFPFHPILLSPFITCFRPFFQILLHYHDSKTQPLSLGYHHLGLYKSGQKISWNFIYLFYLEALLLKFFFIYEFFQGVKAMKQGYIIRLVDQLCSSPRVCIVYTIQDYCTNKSLCSIYSQAYGMVH